MYTRCPHCATVYRVTPQQLQASGGQVKCGRCQAQFDAFTTLAAERPGTPAEPAAAAPPLRPSSAPSAATPPSPASVPVAAAPVQGPTVDQAQALPDPVSAYVHRYGGARPLQEADDDMAPLPVEEEEIDVVPGPPSSIDQFADSLRVFQTVARLSLDVDESRPAPLSDQPWVDTAADASAAPEQEDAAGTRAMQDERDEDQGGDAHAYRTGHRDHRPGAFAPADDAQPQVGEEIVLAAPPPARPEPLQPVLTLPDSVLEGAAPLRRRGLWLAAGGALSLALVVQALWWFATPLARALPGTRPVLEGACALAGCEVELAQLPEQLFIEGSDLQLLDVARPQEVLLTAQVRNRARVAQQLPSIELTLTDTANQVVGRRVLRPDEYLDATQRGRRSIEGNEEIAIRLYLDTGDVRAAGYRLYLFFG